jgi:hypothetical protein
MDFELEYISEFEFTFKTALGYESGVCGRVLIFKNHVQKPRVSVPLNTYNFHETIQQEYVLREENNFLYCITPLCTI